MKKFFLSLMVLSSLSLTAFAQDDVQENQTDPQAPVFEPFLRSCDSVPWGFHESCMSSTNRCPGGYDGTPNYCCSGDNRFHRCGTVCKPIYGGGH